ncbi:hypothetical protein, partial [Klebsiella aerogenes]|uniref:hypothetical protein n=1 Tax=Klebsiella aerogenes TaxID=548 RepID=UPI0021E1278F
MGAESGRAQNSVILPFSPALSRNMSFLPTVIAGNGFPVAISCLPVWGFLLPFFILPAIFLLMSCFLAKKNTLLRSV